MDKEILDGVIKINAEIAVATARKVATSEGILAGISSGAALAAGLELAEKPENKDKKIVVIIPSNGERYLSTVLYADLEV